MNSTDDRAVRGAGDETNPLPLTAAQRGMWFAENLSPDYSVTIAQYLEIRDDTRPLDYDLFHRCILDTGHVLGLPFVRLVEVDGAPHQVIDRSVPFTVEEVDFRHVADPLAAAQAWMNRDYRRPVDLLSPPLAISALIRVADDHLLWYLRAHHITIDGYAALTAMTQVCDRYNAAIAGETYAPKPAADMAEIVADDATYRQSTRRAADREYWTETARELPERVTLAQHANTAPLHPENIVARGRMSDATRNRLDALAAELHTSPAVILTGAFAAYLSRMTGTDDVVLSLPVTGRASARIKRAGGMLSNMLPVRTHDTSTLSLRELIDQLRIELTGALRHQRYRFEDIRIDAGMRDANTASFGPIVNMVFFDKPIEIAGAVVDYQILSSGILEDLRINLYRPGPDSDIIVDLHGNYHLYGQEYLDSHLQRFMLFMERLVAGIDVVVGDVDVLLDGESDDLLSTGRGPRQIAGPDDETVLDRFEAQARRTPDAVAVEFEGEQLTYAQFDAKRTALARRLIADGVAPRDRVVIALDRGIEQVCAVYAVLGAGAAYVPVDPDQPAERRHAIERAVSPRVVIDDAYLAEPAGTPPDAERAPLPRVGSGDAAYVIFTSGSTGTPKGVQVSHGAIVNRLDWMQRDYPIDAADAVLYKTPITFDVSVWELLWPLQTGARMVIAAPGGHRDPEYLFALIERAAVTTMHFVPSMLDVFVDVVLADGHERVLPPSARRVFTSGEALASSLTDRLLSASSVELINLYGPTEAAVDVTGQRVEHGRPVVPIGRPVANTDVYVLDDRLRPVPVGVAGELYLAGSQLADGYVGRPDLTADRFIANPYAQTRGDRMYRTGDLVRWSADTDTTDGGPALEYLGRTDFQIKIRGQRVELGEIEAVIAAVPGVGGTVAVARADAGPATVVAYVRPDAADPDKRTDGAETPTLEPNEILAWCRRRLPSHMVPSAVVLLDHFPVNATGKLDRSALPAPVIDHEISFVAPQSDVERALAKLIGELVGTDRVGMRDNVFALGADSLTAARLVSRARSDHALHVRLTDVFDSDDIAELARRSRLDERSRLPELAPVTERPDQIPLSYAQTRLWFVNRMNPQAPTYNMPGAVRLGDDVNVEALTAAVLDVLGRHESLRTRYPSVDGEPVQEVLPLADVADTVDLTPVPVDGPLTDAVRAAAEAGFDLVNQTGFRYRLLAHSSGHVLVLVLHHIAADGASLRPLITDLFLAYAARRNGEAPQFEPLAVQYTDFALWQRQALGETDDPSPLLAEQLDYWRSELAGVPELLTLPTDRPRPRVPSGQGGYVDLTLDTGLVAAIRDLAQRRSITPFTVVHAALALVLARLGDTDDVAIGIAIAGRDDGRLDDLVGMFVNTVVLRSHVDPARRVDDFLADAHHSRARAMEHSLAPFERVVETVAPHRSLSHSPLFQVGLTMQADQVDGLSAGAGLELLDARVPAAKYDLSLTVTQRGDITYDIEIAYATDLFDHATIEQLGARLRRVLHAMVEQTDGTLGTIDLLPADRVTELTGTPQAEPPRTMRDLLAAGARIADPAARALSGELVVTWEVFEARTNQLARDLIGRGIGPGDVVAIGIPRSHHSVVATVAVAKTGAAFVSIDPRYPADRRAAMLDDSHARIGLTTAAVADDAPRGESVDVEWLVIDDTAAEIEAAGHSGDPIADAELIRPIHIDDVAYLIYTSGSTGRPKAAAVGHRGLANMVANQQRLLGITPESTILHVASPSFDASVFEITMALATGAELVVSPSDVYAGSELDAVIDRFGATHAVMTPSALGTLEPSAVPSLTTVISVGEACPPDLVGRWAGRRFFNLYGPTESTIWATAAGPIAPDTDITIGTAVPGVGALVLDRGLRPVPDGVIGELYLTGAQVALGYHERSALTAARFVANPYDSGTRMYRTGDRVERTPSGELIYHGRNDFQLKIRGLRIEPGEVDGVLMSHPAIAQALSLGVPGPSGESVLVSYVSGTGGHTLLPEQVIDYASARLPGYMVPHTVMIVDEFSLTPAGKIDRSSLPPVEFTMTHDFVPPRSQLEALVSDIFVAVLGLERISVTDGFFELGGNSLSATKVTSRLSAALDRQVPVADIFEAPTVAKLAERLATSMTGHAAPPLIARSRAEMVPVSSVQRGMWLLNRADPESAAYNVALALRMTGPLDFTALHDAIVDIVRRHESLRTSYPMINGEPIQVIIPADVITRDVDVTAVDVDGPLEDAIAAVTGRGFDITASAPMRLAVLRVADDEHVLVFVVHHISADGASMAPLARDLMTAYAARKAGTEPIWPPMPVQYADYTLWQQEKLSMADPDGRAEEQRQLDYWAQRLAGAPERIDLPTDRPRPKSPSFAGGAVDFEIPAELVRSLESVARVHNTTLFMVAHAAFAVLLSRISGRDELVIGTPYAGRGDAVLENVVGMFVNTLALRTHVAADEPFHVLLERVRGEDLADMANTDVSFESIVSRLLPSPPTSYNPLFQVMFAFQNIEFPALDFAGLRVAPVSEQLISAKVDLQLTLFPDDPTGTPGLSDGAIKGQFVYATDLFDAETVETIAARLLRVLDGIAVDPACIVGDIVIHTVDELAVDDLDTTSQAPDSTAVPLPALVAMAADVDAAAQALARDGASMTFGQLQLLCSAMAAMGDADAALTTALMSGIPGLAVAGPDALEEALNSLRANAVRVLGQDSGRTMSTDGSDHR
ncbi:hypothetical protein GCM10009624_03240 [Gordonia sinesedis]